MSPAPRFSALALALCGAAIVPGLAAQHRPATLPRGSSFAITGGGLLFDGSDADAGIKALTLRFTTLRPNGLSFDVGAGLLVAGEAGAFSLEVGPAFNISIPGATLLLRAGGTGIVAGGGGLVGGYAGLGVLFRVANGVGFRLDVARHQYAIGSESLGAWQLGGGIALLPRIR
jgi:hypothetical protein